MAKITTVDYEAIPSQASQMREYGRELNNELKSAYQSIAEMHNSWYGKRYNSLVEQFNALIPELNEMLELVVGEIPFTLETVANNYSQADRGANCTSANRESPNKITELPISNDVGMRFLTGEVQSVQSDVSKNFKESESKMNTIESVYSRIVWESEAASAFATRFKRLKTEIVTAFQNIEESFSKLMLQAQEDVQAAENANTVQ